MTATLWAATEGKDTDWNVMLQHVYPDGRAERIQDGVMRARFREGFDRPSLLKPRQIYKYDIDLWFTSRVIPAGHRLRVVVASAGVPEIRPQPEHRWGQRTGHALRRGQAADSA
jgi:predicted acyl esterase